jgi:hypothetical protein
MLGMHLTPAGTVRKDVDFVIERAGNIPLLREHLPAIRSKLGFTEVTGARQGRQYERYRQVFRNDNNSTDLVIARRRTALQAAEPSSTAAVAGARLSVAQYWRRALIRIVRYSLVRGRLPGRRRPSRTLGPLPLRARL